jgi:hypothetical protein
MIPRPSRRIAARWNFLACQGGEDGLDGVSTNHHRHVGGVPSGDTFTVPIALREAQLFGTSYPKYRLFVFITGLPRLR